MNIAKSNKLIFVAKLILLLPLSYSVVLVSLYLSASGRGNWFPLVLIVGPLNILNSTIGLDPLWGDYLIWGTTCLFEIYALILKFIKNNKIILFLIIFHVISSVMEMLFLVSKNYNMGYITLLFVIVPLLIIVWLFVSIYRSREQLEACPDN